MNNQSHTIEIYNRYVKEYSDKFMNLDLYKDTFDYLVDKLPTGANVLELGCGPGNVARHLMSKRADLQMLGIDLAPNMIEAARKANPGAEFRLLDIRHAREIHRHFHGVIAAFCIPYLAVEDLTGLFVNMKRLTTEKKGMIYLSFMEGQRERSGFEKTSFTGTSEMYINYYPRNAIESMMKEHDFVIKKLYTKDYPETDGSTTTDLIYIAERCNLS
jgi:cyclopropane fatty-acyl-phospholipid synthase-like methyltransferase